MQTGTGWSGIRLIRPLLCTLGFGLLAVTAWRLYRGVDQGTLGLVDLWRAKLLWIGIAFTALGLLPKQRFAPIEANLASFVRPKIVAFIAMALVGLFATRAALIVVYDEEDDFGTPRVAGFNSAIVRLGPLVSFRNFLEQKDKIDVLIFGTSVVWVLGDEKFLGDRGLSAFNARGITYGNPNVIYEFLEKYLDKLPRLKYVVVGLHDNEALDARMPYADAIPIPNENEAASLIRTQRIKRLLFADSTTFSYAKLAIRKNALGDKRISFAKNGTATITKVMTEPEFRDEEAKAAAARRAGYPHNLNIDDGKLAYLEKIAGLLAGRGIGLFVLVSPYHQLYLEQIGYQRIAELVSRAFRWHRPLDTFALCNALTRDRRNYVDPFHPNDNLSERMWAALFSGRTAVDNDGEPFYRRLATEADLRSYLALVKTSCFDRPDAVRTSRSQGN